MKVAQILVGMARPAVLSGSFRVVAKQPLIQHSHLNANRSFQTLSAPLLAGHSHWHNIKATKEAKDKQKCNTISQWIGKIRKTIAASGNPDPKTNSELAKLIEEARGRDVPKDSIDRALKNSLRGAGSKVVILECKGPGGVAIIIEGLTDKLARTRSEIGWLLKKNGGQFVDSNSIKHQFQEKGTIDATLPATIKPEQVEDLAIEAEAEEFTIDTEVTPNTVRFLCDAAEVFKVCNVLKQKGFVDAQAQVEFIPHIMRPIDETTGQALDKLLGVLEEHIEVLNIYNNATLAE